MVIHYALYHLSVHFYIHCFKRGGQKLSKKALCIVCERSITQSANVLSLSVGRFHTMDIIHDT